MDENRMAETGRSTAQEVKETAEEWTDKAKGAAEEWTGKAKGKLRDAGATADLYVHEYAWTSVVAVGLVGVVVGYLLGTRAS